MSKHTILLIGGAEGELGTLSTSSRGDDCCIAFLYRGRTVEAAAPDYFEALCQIRLELEKEQLMPLCYGASLDVYPSRMARDMGAGLKAYRMTAGKHSAAADLVDIFAAGPDVVPASVARQRAFFEEWLDTPRV